MKKLDLHGIKHVDVRRALDTFYWESMQNGDYEIEIVTGISERMKQIVEEVTEEYGFKISEIQINPGSLIITI